MAEANAGRDAAPRSAISHPFTLSCAINMANCLHDLGRFEEAEALAGQTRTQFAEVLGPLHPDTLVCEANLAVSCT